MATMAPARGTAGGGNRTVRARGGSGNAVLGTVPMLLVLIVFTAIALPLFLLTGDQELARVKVIASSYGNAWRDGRLDSLVYDKLSWPDVPNADAKKISENVAWITRYLDDSGTLRPKDVSVAAVTPDPARSDFATATLNVTWELQRTGLDQVGQIWKYPVTLTLHRGDGGRWQVVWNPSAVHPQIVHGLVLQKFRVLAPRAAVIGAGDTPLPLAEPAPAPPKDPDTMGQALLGAVTGDATHEQAELAALRAVQGDAIGVRGLQAKFDERLSGGASIQVKAVRDERYAGLPDLTVPLFVGPPETPTPVKITLDRRTQERVEAALLGVNTAGLDQNALLAQTTKKRADYAKKPTSAATLVVIDKNSGDLLASAATTGAISSPKPGDQPPGISRQDAGLLAQRPAGQMFGLVSGLALLRAGNQLNTRVDCSAPWTYQGQYRTQYQSQVFRNAEPPDQKKVPNASKVPGIPGVTLGAALEGGCVTGLARSGFTITPQAVQSAAYDLGMATPATSSLPDLPDNRVVTEQLGTWAFNGTVAVDDNPLHHLENVIGEGQVLVSPLSMARAAATVGSGTRRSVTLVVDPPATAPDLPKNLAPQEVASLQEVMSKAVTEPGGSAHALLAIGGPDLHAMAGTSTYGTGGTKTRTAWCVGYRGDEVFAVMVPQAQTDLGTTEATAVAANFLTLAR